MKQLTIGVAILIVTLTLTFGVAAAHGLAGAAMDEATVDNQHEDCEAMTGEMENCPMADGGMMGMMHDDDMEECQERMDATGSWYNTPRRIVCWIHHDNHT